MVIDLDFGNNDDGTRYDLGLFAQAAWRNIKLRFR